MAFQYPWFFNMPPFFTLQPVINTRKKQLQMWKELVLAYARHHRTYEINVKDAASSPLFYNKAINRRLQPEGIRFLFDDMAKSGNGEWLNREKTMFNVYWKSPEEWGKLIYSWVEKTGQIGTVLTVYELRQGDETTGEEFHGLELPIFIRAVQTLEERGRAQLFSGDKSDESGVKFFAG